MRNLARTGIVHFLTVIVALFCVVAGCGGDSDGGTAGSTGGSGAGTGGSAQTCTPYETVSCPCFGGSMGTQQCDAYGTFYSECVCPQTGAGAGGGGMAGTIAGGSGGTAGASGTVGYPPEGGTGGTAGAAGASGMGGTGGMAGVSGWGGTGGTAGMSGTGGTGGIPSTGGACPAGFSCLSNSFLDSFQPGLLFCAPDDASTQFMAGAMGPTPPVCTNVGSADECNAIGLQVSCTELPFLGPMCLKPMCTP